MLFRFQNQNNKCFVNSTRHSSTSETFLHKVGDFLLHSLPVASVEATWESMRPRALQRLKQPDTLIDFLLSENPI